MTDRKVRVQLPVGWEAHHNRGISERFARSAYVEYCAQGHGDQSFERLHERGGFGVTEIMLLLCERIQRLETDAGYGVCWRTGVSEALEAEREAWKLRPKDTEGTS